MAAGSHSDSDVFVEVPEHLISKAALLYVGYTNDKAEELWSRWCNWPADGPRREIDAGSGSLYVTFADFITAHIGTSDTFPDNTWADNTAQWVRCLRHYGLNDDTITAILDAQFDNIRRTETCAFWAKDTLTMRYAGIEEMRRESNKRAEVVATAAAAGSARGSRSQRAAQRSSFSHAASS